MKRLTSVIVGLAAVGMMAAPAAAQMMGYGYGDGWYGHGGGWWPLHGLVPLLLLAVLVVAVVLSIRAFWHVGGRDERGGRSSALGALDARYAKGEIERDDYLQRKKDLGEGS